MQKTIKNLKQNGFNVILAKDAKEALTKAKEFFKNINSVGLGGSETVSQVGLLDWLQNQNSFKLFNQYEKGISKEENTERRRQGILADIFVTSSNAVSQDGYLINVDGSGNRVAGQIYGSKKVLLIVGKNKIVKDVEAGFARIEKVVAPKNVERLNAKALSYKKPATHTAQNIQSIFCVIKKTDDQERVNIILVNDDLGY